MKTINTAHMHVTDNTFDGTGIDTLIRRKRKRPMSGTIMMEIAVWPLGLVTINAVWIDFEKCEKLKRCMRRIGIKNVRNETSP